jgi:hypothetical protein
LLWEKLNMAIHLQIEEEYSRFEGLERQIGFHLAYKESLSSPWNSTFLK